MATQGELLIQIQIQIQIKLHHFLPRFTHTAQKKHFGLLLLVVGSLEQFQIGSYHGVEALSGGSCDFIGG